MSTHCLLCLGHGIPRYIVFDCILPDVQAILLEHLGNEETIKSRYSLVSEPEPQRPLPPPSLPLPPPLGMTGSAFVSGGNLPLSAVDTRTPPAPSEARQGPEDPAERQRQLERERERRERERKEEARHEDRRLQDLERALDRAEAERERERQREAERLREAHKSRQRELERDLQDGGASSEDAVRRAFQKRRHDTRARDERRRKRQRELEEDDAERRREMADAAAQQLVVEEAADRAARAADVPVPTTTAVPQALEPVEQPMAPNGAPPPEDSAAGAQIGGVFVPGTSLGTLGFLKKAPVKRTTVNAPLFSETEEAPARRTLVPLEYTEEELRAALVNEYAQPEEPPEPAGAAAAAPEPADEARRSERTERRRREKEERDAKRALLAMIDAIPTTKDALFAHPVDWPTFDKHNVSSTVASWATKKVAELLGEAPPALVDFITQQTAQHVAPQAILDELQMVLVRSHGDTCIKRKETMLLTPALPFHLVNRRTKKQKRLSSSCGGLSYLRLSKHPLRFRQLEQFTFLLHSGSRPVAW